MYLYIYIYTHYMHNMLNVINHRKPSPVLRLWDAFTIPLLFARYAQSLTLTWIKPHSHIVSLKTEKSEFVQIPWVIIFCPFFFCHFWCKKSPLFQFFSRLAGSRVFTADSKSFRVSTKRCASCKASWGGKIEPPSPSWPWLLDITHIEKLHMAHRFWYPKNENQLT